MIREIVGFGKLREFTGCEIQEIQRGVAGKFWESCGNSTKFL